MSGWDPSYKVKPVGECGAVLILGDKIDERINDLVHAICKKIESEAPEWIEEVIPTYCTVHVYFDPMKVSFSQVSEYLLEVSKKTEAKELKGRTVKIPVAYGGKFGPDIEFVAKHNGLSVEEVIEIHQRPLYRVFMLGFTPGFAYLGGMDKRIATPRLEKPRVKVPAGSVGIAGPQTGIYPIESPGGWRLIGRTPLRLFNPEKDPPTLLLPGDRVKFYQISEEEFWEIYRGEWERSRSWTPVPCSRYKT